MVNSKDKGKRWEKDVEELLNSKYPSTWKRLPGSGAFGTQMNIPELSGDLVGAYFFMPIKFRADAKTGYGGATQLTMKREWFEKIRREAEDPSLMAPEIPCILCKFSNSRSDVRYFISFDFEAFEDILDIIETLWTENAELRDKLIDRG